MTQRTKTTSAQLPGLTSELSDTLGFLSDPYITASLLEAWHCITCKDRQALQSIKDYTCPSEDGVEAAFFKYATVGIGERLGKSLQEHMLVACTWY
jgi:hypothetical protein